MATDAFPNSADNLAARIGDVDFVGSAKRIAAAVLTPLASLKLAVVLFALAIFLVFVGTLAQVDNTMWDVLKYVFSSWITWIDFKVLVPRTWFPNAHEWIENTWPIQKFPMPGGGTIGLLMLINLLSAHLIKFKIRARGTRLSLGVALVAAGVLLTTFVIVMGHNRAGMQATVKSWALIWEFCKVAVLVVGGALVGRFWSVWKADSTRKAELWLLGLSGGFLLSLALFLIIGPGRTWYVGDSGMRILWQLVQGTFCGLVLLSGCHFLFEKRAGVVLLHTGVVLMMFGQFFVSHYDVEEQMTMKEGQILHYGQDIRSIELAVTDAAADKDGKTELVVPQSALLHSSGDVTPSWFARRDAKPLVGPDGVVRDDSLPFDLKVVKYFKNATLRKVKPDDENLATAGDGLTVFAEPLRASTGTDTDSKVDLSAAYVTLLEKGTDKPLGTYLLSILASMNDYADRVTVGDKEYEVALRFKRSYKPYAIQLLDVQQQLHKGTSKPRSFSSDVRLVNTETGDDRHVHIWMNNPLRYAGETFYQSGYNVDRGQEITTLQVVRNYGWMIPYVSCMIVIVGMTAHFGNILLRFLRRTLEQQPVVRVQAVATSWSELLVPGAVTGAVALLVLYLMFPPRDGEVHLQEFGELPVVSGGRVKPFDSLARETLQAISGKTSFKEKFPVTGEDGKPVLDKYGDPKVKYERRPAIRWLLDVIAGSPKAEDHEVVRVDHPEVQETLGLKRRKGFLYSINEIREKYDGFHKDVQLIRGKQQKKEALTAYERKVLEVDRRLQTYMMLLTAFRPPNLPDLPTNEELRSDRKVAMVKLSEFRQAYQEVTKHLEAVELPLAVPVTDEKDAESWQPYARAWMDGIVATNLAGMDPQPATLHMNKMFVAYNRGEVSVFNRELSQYRRFLEQTPPQNLNLPPTWANRFVQGLFGPFYAFEKYFNDAAPFSHALWIGVLSGVFVVMGWLFSELMLHRTGRWLLVLSVLLQTCGLVARVYISGKGPVTNLYGSAIFIAWATTLMGLLVEFLFPNFVRRVLPGVGSLTASVASGAALLIASLLAADGDTMPVLQAVLDTQFWLWTHVLCITLGYAATFFAGLLAIIHLGSAVRGLIQTGGQGLPKGDERSKEFARMIYGTLCFATLFSFFGTVLGGLWADDSWGRFWGWDPKENGALIIVLWNVLVLHARWDGMVRELGLSVLAVVGNIVTAWSWFGVNELGVGLHSYGFTEGVVQALLCFMASQLAIVIGGVVVARMVNRSRRDEPVTTAALAG